MREGQVRRLWRDDIKNGFKKDKVPGGRKILVDVKLVKTVVGGDIKKRNMKKTCLLLIILLMRRKMEMMMTMMMLMIMMITSTY